MSPNIERLAKPDLELIHRNLSVSIQVHLVQKIRAIILPEGPIHKPQRLVRLMLRNRPVPVRIDHIEHVLEQLQRLLIISALVIIKHHPVLRRLLLLIARAQIVLERDQMSRLDKVLILLRHILRYYIGPDRKLQPVVLILIGCLKQTQELARVFVQERFEARYQEIFVVRVALGVGRIRRERMRLQSSFARVQYNHRGLIRA